MAGSADLFPKYEIARVDHTKQKVYHKKIGLVGDKIKLPDAKWWHPFSKDEGDMAFSEKPELFTSHFNLDGSRAYKYNFWQSMKGDKGQEVKAYQHCGGLHTIFVRQAPSLRVYVSTSQPIGVGETTHMITLASAQPIFGNSVIFEKEFGNDGSDITLGQILPVARCHLIEDNHLTYAGKLEVIFEGMNITTKLNTVLVKRFGSNEPRKKRKTLG